MSQFENGKQTNHLDFWGLRRTDGELLSFGTLQSAAKFAGSGGVTFIVASSKAATSTFLNYMPELNKVIQAAAVPLAKKLRVQDRLSRWKWSSAGGKKEFAKEEEMSVKELEERLKEEEELLKAECFISSIDFLFGINGRPVVRVHHGRWDLGYDVLKEVFERIRQEYLKKPTTATPAPADTPASTTADAPAADIPF